MAGQADFHEMPGLKTRLYSNWRTVFAVIDLDCGCRGLMRTVRSSGTITEGTSSMGERLDSNHAEPNLTLALPAGMAAQVTGRSSVANSSLAAQTRAGTSSSIR